nr:retrovirus-related Pol polyprotein from transposon TNT 1-94 [Tanacetum cinerariifolium]
MPLSNPQRHVVLPAVLTQSKLVPINAVRPVSTVVPKIKVTRPRQAKTVVTKSNSPPRRHINRSLSSKASTFPLKVTAVKALMVNVAQIQVINGLGPKEKLTILFLIQDFKELYGGYVAFGGNLKGGKISRKGKIRTGKLEFDDVYFVKDLKFNLFSVLQMCDKKNSDIFTDTECLVLSHEFKLPDENQVLLRVPMENYMYNVSLKNIVPSRDLTCLFVKATLDESNLWNRRLDHINFNTINKLVKGIKREFSVPRTPQQNRIAERKNRTLIEAAKTMLADSLLPIPFWAEAVNTACYVQNRVLVTKAQNKTPYELLHGRTTSIGFIRPFSCLVTILNTLDSLGKFDRKVDEGFLVGYFVSSKAFRVFNSRTRIVQETLHVNFLENNPNVTEKAREESLQQYVLFPVWSLGSINPHNTDGDAAFDKKEPEFEGRKPESEVNVSPSSSAQLKKHDDKTKRKAKGKIHVNSLTRYRNLSSEFDDFSDNNINEDNAAGTLVPAVGRIRVIPVDTRYQQSLLAGGYELFLLIQ